MSILRKTAWNTSRLIAQNGGAVSRALYKVANLYKKTYNNLNYDMNTNGEYYLLDRLSTAEMKTVLDVGANKGDYTLACLSRFKDANVHSFEIAPPTYQKLTNNVSSKRVKLNNFGLSNKDGSFYLNYNPDDDGSSSLVEGSNIHDGNWSKIQVNVIRGDDYCKNECINSVDLLKVDVEGAEHLVFDGFSESFEKNMISTVQFEFGMVNIYSKFLLKDFYDLFSKHGFVLGPVMPSGVDFKEYNTRDEDFQGPPNFFAVHKSKPRIIEAVKK
ncbi:FkbM family methyltransferase [Bosea sp. LjRoot9]|uniref:FkbM family methyltransferase n=1 Tax=Bosea sp. LjRoot9 TaxID=3342341 RepID=UPI003ED133C5